MNAASGFRERIREAQANRPVIEAIHLATLRKVEQRAAGMGELRNAEELRDLAAQIKQHTLERLPDYLEQFVAAVERNGGRVHVAADAREAQRIITGIATASGATLAVKSKSMTTEEVHLNAALETAGVRVVETDLGEFIVQLDRDRPSHIVTPIIHKNRRDVARTMARELGCEYTEDPVQLTQIARRHLREVFRRCDLGISGVNFGIAETGSIVLCTNEGNGRMTVTRPRVHVALMGIEKLIPRRIDLPVFLKLLARSSTGQPLTVYTTLIHGPRRPDELDGPGELHVVLLDHGRSALLGGPYEDVLRCIRCGACLNACPVYRNIGGHAYGSVYPGPIGSLVTPLLEGVERHADLARASSLCGACGEACPVRIDIPRFLVQLRADTRDAQPLAKRAGVTAWALAVASRGSFEFAQRLLRLAARRATGRPSAWLGPLVEWTRVRDLPTVPPRGFREIWTDGLADE